MESHMFPSHSTNEVYSMIMTSCNVISLDPVKDRFATLHPSWKSLRTLCLRSALPRIPQHHISTEIVQRPPHGTGLVPCSLLDISCYDEIISAPSGVCYPLTNSPHRSLPMFTRSVTLPAHSRRSLLAYLRLFVLLDALVVLRLQWHHHLVTCLVRLVQR